MMIRACYLPLLRIAIIRPAMIDWHQFDLLLMTVYVTANSLVLTLNLPDYHKQLILLISFE